MHNVATIKPGGDNLILSSCMEREAQRLWLGESERSLGAPRMNLVWRRSRCRGFMAHARKEPVRVRSRGDNEKELVLLS